ncbi:MAG: 50S ribosomal protein L35 [Candidatus Colwellbacteria bacterium]|nr:50S ribosomal protein L35 [Candidatus Colwellbacteria bacterium]
MKTRKSVSKRIRITKTGKILRRKMAQGHFRASKSGKQIRDKRGSIKMSESDHKNMRVFLKGQQRGN